MIAIREKLGRGIYTPSEAALYARVQTRLLNRWLYSKGGEPVIEPEFGHTDKGVSFLDFVQALAVRDIRNTFGVPLEKIREAYELARKHYKVKYPFAMRHKTFLFGEKEYDPTDAAGRKKKRRLEVVIRLDDESLVQLTGKERGNLMIAEVSQLYMLDLTFEGKGGVADSYRPLRLGIHSVLMNPKVRFGEPIIETCGYSAMALYDSYKAEGTIDAAAKVYGVERAEVELAIKYVDYLQRPTA
jgi:uncharacterized protein (DUF433 family)